jgi:hypothetical protein
MNKEKLKVRLGVLQANAEVLAEQLNDANNAAIAAAKELENINKPKITEDVANELVSNLCRAFNDALSSISTEDLGIDFSLDYNNTVVVDDISGLDDIDAPEDHFHEILSDIFAITLDEDEDVYNKP